MTGASRSPSPGRPAVPERAGRGPGRDPLADRHRQVRADRPGRLPDGPAGGLQRPGAPCPLRGGLAGDRAGAGLGLYRLPGRSEAEPGHERRRAGQLDRARATSQDDQRIVDDQARAEFLRQGSPMGGLFGAPRLRAEQLAKQMEQDVTLTAVDLDAAAGAQRQRQRPGLCAAGDATRAPWPRRAPMPSPSPASLAATCRLPISTWATSSQLLKQQHQRRRQSPRRDQACWLPCSQAIIAEKHGAGQARRHRRVDLLPQLAAVPHRRSPVRSPTPPSPTALPTNRCGTISWPTTTPAAPSSRPPRSRACPQRSAHVHARRARADHISPVTPLSQVAAPGQPVTLSADISGENIGYV